MSSTKHFELLIGFILVVIILALTDPVDFLMPTSMQMTALVLAVVTYAIFAGLMFREKATDEREIVIRNQSSRAGYLVGTTGLLIAISWQTISHQLDNWLVWILGAMILTKVIFIYKNRIE